MVELEPPQDGIVTLRFVPPYADGDEQAYLDGLAAVSREPGPFALLTVFGGGGKLSREGERAQALWFKATRAKLNETCRALAMVRPGATQAMADVFGRLWSFPVTVCPDEQAARHWLAAHLQPQGPQPGGPAKESQ